MLAAKTTLAVRYDALGEDGSQEIGLQGRAKIESRLREVEQGQVRQLAWSCSCCDLIGCILVKEDQWYWKSNGQSRKV